MILIWNTEAMKPDTTDNILDYTTSRHGQRNLGGNMQTTLITHAL